MLGNLVVLLAVAACTHYASPNGTGNSCTKEQPCKIASFWSLAGPGKVLCLKDGTYRGSDSMIRPPAGLRGTHVQPITIRAENDGQVTLDAQHQGFAVDLSWHNGLNSNNWFVVEGINATNGAEALYNISSSDSVLKRVIGYHGTNGQQNAYIFNVIGYRSRAEDCAAWGANSRKIMNGSQAGNIQGAGFRRCWAEWNDHPQGGSNPNNTYQMGYNTTNQIYENVIGTWDTRGETAEVQSVLHVFSSNDAGTSNNMQGSKVLGSVFYAASGQNFAPDALVNAAGVSGLLFKDIAAIATEGYTQVAPFRFNTCSAPTLCINNRCENCLAVHAGTPTVNQPSSGWRMPGLRQGRTLEEATGGTSAFELLPGICKQYIGGELTDEPLWPWPMEARIKAARNQLGFSAVEVTKQIEELLGPIPANCKRGETPTPEPPTPPASTALNCVGVQGSGGNIAIACAPK